MNKMTPKKHELASGNNKLTGGLFVCLLGKMVKKGQK